VALIMLSVPAMRGASPAKTVLVITALSSLGAGCTLYFGNGSADDIYIPPDADGSGSGWGSGSGSGSDLRTWARCEEGVVRRLQTDLPPGDMPGHGAGVVIGMCEAACQSAIAECPAGNCTDAFSTVCGAPAAKGAPTPLQGATCSASNNTVSYGETTKCGESIPGGTCTCNTGTYNCTPATGTAAIHASLVGKWRGMVSPPDFTAPYPVSLWIYPDGTYWGECTEGPSYCNAFYYGGDGPHPWRRIKVLADSSSTGAYADIGIFYSFNVGALSNLYVSDTTLTFTYNAAWQNCAQPFYFTLTRQP
jgi:hypothetical protein